MESVDLISSNLTLNITVEGYLKLFLYSFGLILFYELAENCEKLNSLKIKMKMKIFLWF